MKSKRTFWDVITSTLILSLCLIYPALAGDARYIAKKVFPSVVMLVMEDSAGQPLSLGSGFFVREDIVATNLHVIEGASGGYAKIIGAKSKYDIAGYVAIDEKHDLVLLKINKAKAEIITLGDSAKVAIGDEVFVVGNPKGLEGTFSKGIVSAIRNIGDDSLLQITAPISPGSSGGPVLSEKGEVIGVAVATFKGGQNLNFAIPVSYLSKLLSDLKPMKKLAIKKKPEKKTKSILDDLGGRSSDGVICSEFLWDYAFNPFGVSFGTNGRYTLSLINQLRVPIKNVRFLVIFYNWRGKPIDVDAIIYYGTIPAQLAKRTRGQVDSSVQKLTTDDESLQPSTKIEFRVLDFKIMEESEEIFKSEEILKNQ